MIFYQLGRDNKMEIFYHITETSKIPSIRKKGLLISHRKNVPLSKKNVTYLMRDLVHAGFFASEMSWKRDANVSIIHVKINPKYLRQDYNTGATIGKWYEYHADIKPSQIVKIEKWDQKAKARHAKLMDKLFK